MTEDKPLPDHVDRDSAIANHHESIFIDAGAGTGKTETIVTRIVNQIVSNPEFGMSDIAAITFTEKAGAELRNRFRRRLEASKSEANPKDIDRIETAIVSVDSAAIGTIHSFCKRILTDHSIAAKLPVGFKIGSESAGPRKRILRARVVADLTLDSMTQEEQQALRDIDFGTRKMEELVVELDSKFAIVNELQLGNVVEVANEYEIPVYKFIHTAIKFLIENQTDRRNSGEIEFDDLLIMTRDLLQSDENLRKAVGEQFKVILVDEFQDTDPIQWQIVRLLTHNSATDASPRTGSLVLVGDPKQSIYRFRNADIDTFLNVKNGFSKSDSSTSYGAIRDLSTNFRSVKPVIEFVNALFDNSAGGEEHPLYMGVGYQGLNYVHNPIDPAAGPAVRILSNPAPLEGGEKPEIDVALECDWTAKEIRRAITQKYKITVPVSRTKREYRDEPANFGDVCILIPVRTRLSELIRALSANEVPFVSADPTIVFTRPLVLGLINSLRVVAQLDDDMSLWAALKSPIFGLTDEQLVQYKRQPRSNWNIDGFASGGEDSVLRAMEVFYDVRNKVGKQSPFKVMQEILDTQEIFEKLQADKNGSFEASALRILLSHATQWENEGNTGLLEYTEALEILTDNNSKTLLPMPDDIDTNAVQIMTIHASKGLEFPITVVTCMASWPKNHSPRILISKTGAIEFYLGKDDKEKNIASAGYENLKNTEEKAASLQEANRLLYVAMTRARDHLIVSSIWIQANSRSTALKSAIEKTSNLNSEGKALFELVDHSKTINEPLPEESAAKTKLVDFRTDYSPEIQASLKRHVVSPSSDAAVEMRVLSSAKAESFEVGDDDTTNDFGIDETVKSSSISLAHRDRRPFGRALHGVMDLIIRHGSVPDDEELQAFLWQLAEQENVLQDLPDLARKIEMLLESDVVLEALEAEQSWPELQLAIADPEDEIRLAEGFADLVYKTPTGYVLVDYKTDKEITLSSMMHYEQQLGAYGLIIKQLTGSLPERTILLHITEDSVETIDL
jgi:ATP-dependent helicase/nuclease subunit A